MQYHVEHEWEDSKHAEVRAIARKALLQLMEPLAGFASDLGFSAGELQAILREAAVKSAAARHLEDSNRINISGIAATTGIPRAEISRILKSAKAFTEQGEKPADAPQQSTNRILAAWHEDPKFTGPNGQPADLKLYGRGTTFETLAKRYGRGIPTRAVLDELIRSGAIELLPTQKIRAKASMTVERGVSARVIKAFGERAAELLNTMLSNMRIPESPNFVASVSDATILRSSLPLFRKELSIKGADFLADIQDVLSRRTRSRSHRHHDDGPVRVSVTIFCHESSISKIKKIDPIIRRRNFRRAG